MNKQSKTDIWINNIYQNKWLLIRYFITALFCAVIRYFVNIFFAVILGQPAADSEFISWCIWTAVFYPCLKFFTFRAKSPHIYALLKQIIIYILVCSVLWFTRQLFIGILFTLTASDFTALSIGGCVNELICLFFMIKVVFRQKLKN